MEENILSASVPITLDGRRFLLSYKAHAFITYAEVCQSDLLRDIYGLSEQLVAMGNVATINSAALFTRFRDLLWVGMLEADPKAERTAVAHLFGFADVGPVMTAITEALKLTAPVTPGPPARPTNPPAAEGSRRIDGRSSGLPSETEAELQPANFAA